VTYVNNNTYATTGVAITTAQAVGNLPVKIEEGCDNTTISGCHFNVYLVAMGDASTRVVSVGAMRGAATDSTGTATTNWAVAITAVAGDSFGGAW
jgi:hypothetical protein